VEQRDDERLGATAIRQRKRRAYPLEEQICQELEGCYVVFTYRLARYVNMDVLLDPSV
jgi:hypothetical protein